jgi:4-hydroxy-4-methyl-2-oxoglutarate aldolase
MKRLFLFAGLVAASAPAQMFTLTREQMVKYTAKNPFERFPDGRPKAPDALLEKCKGLSAEEVWAVVEEQKYPNQYADKFKILHPGMKLIGRAVTAQFMPVRPDLNDVMEADAKAADKGKGAQHQRVIDTLQPGDVLVADIFGKLENGTLVGDNLATAIYAFSKNGFVVDGAFRDLEGIYPIGMQVYYRGEHPTPIRNVMVTGYNVPIRIGSATVMPGDIVFGDREGVYFIPPHLLKAVLDRADETHIHDEWTKEKMSTGKYRSVDLYPRPSDPALVKEYEDYKKKKLGK